MKHFVFLLLLILSQSLFAQAPWSRIVTTPQENDINDIIRIPDTDRLIAVANGSTVMTSDNAGETWNVMLHPANMDNTYMAEKVCFIDDMTGFIGGSRNTILKTTDGGSTWSVKYEIAGANNYTLIDDICFMNDTTGLAISNNGLKLKSTDRGETWSEVVSDRSEYPKKIVKQTEDMAYIISFYSLQWAKTTDGGDTWVSENIPFGNPGDYLTDLYFLNDSTGIASISNESNSSIFYKTTDGGISWTEIYTTSWGLLDCEFNFYDEQHGIAVSNTIMYYSTVFVTEDGGNTWTHSEQQLYCPGLQTTCSYDLNTVFVSGQYGMIYKSTDLGYAWYKVSHRQMYGEIYRIQFIDENTGFAGSVGFGGGAGFTQLFKTTDGGLNWEAHFDVGYYSEFDFLNDSVGFITNSGSELYSNVSGEWTSRYTGFDFESNDIDFYDVLNGVIAGGDRVIVTADGGNSWTDITPVPNQSIGYNNIEFRPSGELFVTGDEKLYRSLDGGWSWQLTSFSQYGWIDDLYFVNADTAFVSAGLQILKSVDGGASWNTTEIHGDGYFAPGAVYFPDSQTGYAVGEGYYYNMLKTTDGGDTWDTISPYSSSVLNCVYFSDADNGLVFGDMGIVMQTSTGGLVETKDIPLPAASAGFRVQPNPFNREFRLSFTRLLQYPLNLIISDISGREIIRLVINDDSEMAFHPEGLCRGVYLFTLVQRDGKSETQKVIRF